MIDLKINYDELTEMPLEDAKKIVGEFNKESFLEDIGVLCEYDEKWMG